MVLGESTADGKQSERDWPAVYVVVAHCTDTERIAEVDVYDDLEAARSRFKRLKEIYGGANVCMASRRVYGI